MRFFKFFSVLISTLLGLSLISLVSCAQTSAGRAADESKKANEVNSEGSDLDLKDLATGEDSPAVESVPTVTPAKESVVKKSTSKEEKPAKKKSASKVSADLRELSEVFEDLQSASSVSMKVKKKVTSPWLTEPKEASGSIAFAKGKIRMKIDDPYPSLLVLTGKDIWLEEKQPEEFGGKIQVSHFKADRARKSSALLALLFGESEIWNELTLQNKKTADGQITFDLKPKDMKRLEVKDLKIVVSESKRELKAVSFSDELENLTAYQFSSIKKSNSSKSDLFKYSPPKGAEVTRF